jgi:hypothetical protein
MSETEKAAAQKAAEKAAAEEVYAARKAEAARARAKAARAEATSAEAAWAAMGRQRWRGARDAEEAVPEAPAEEETDKDKEKRAAAIRSIEELALNSKESIKESIVHILKNGFNTKSVININWRAQYLSLLILMYARNGDIEITITAKPKVKPNEDSDKVLKHWAHCATEGYGLETDPKDGNTIDSERLGRAKNDIVTTIKTILLDDSSTSIPISGEPYLVLKNVAEIIMRVKKMSKTDIAHAEATKLAKWAISDDGINIIDEAIAEQNGFTSGVPEWAEIIKEGDATIETHDYVDPVYVEPEYSVNFDTRKKKGGLRRKQPRKKQPRRKQSTRKQPRRKQSTRKQPRRKQSTRKQPRRK